MKKKTLLYVLILAVFMLGGLQDALALEVWTLVAPLPVPMVGGLVQCSDDPDSFYIVSGIMRRNANTKFLFRYDISTDTWEKLAGMPDALRGTSVACYQGKIYAAGGSDLKAVFNTLYIYDIATNKWSRGPDLPDPVVGAKMGVWAGKLYLVGGSRDFSMPIARVDVYDVATGVWTTGGGAPMPYAAWSYADAQDGSYFYAVGGFGETSNLDKTQRYDLIANTWEIGPTFTSMRAVAGLVVTTGHLYAMGGDIEDGDWVFHSTDLVEVLDLSTWPEGAWVDTGTPLPAANLFPPTACTEVLNPTGGEIWDVGGGLSAYSTTTDVYYLPIEEGCP